ncbi:MAG TPA: UDP-N-acetylglucosamine 2-epimerase (non-hydrolyzing) [Terriglobia bacterium]|nr:UDP-N-acetylglucosamine 2-epimerase (non-hydrolyzing) [Terriglobia bacterium]
MKILSVVGTRPNFIKIAPLLKEMKKVPQIETRLVHTGQHYDREMSDAFFKDLNLPVPDWYLGVGPGSPASQIGEIMMRLEPVLSKCQPNVVLVVGDVNSTLAAALAAAKTGIPVVHVEAGLRSFDRTMPEEINRILTDALADLLFASEPSGVENLRWEGIHSSRIFLAGNVMIDTLRQYLPFAESSICLTDLDGDLETPVPPKYAVLTLHRQGLVDNPQRLMRVWNVMEEIGNEIPIIFPVHPRTRLRLEDAGLKPQRGNGFGNAGGIRMVAPLSYLQFISLQRQAVMVMTDSGGVQEETTVLGVPCLTLRENTERPITVTEGTNMLVGLNPERIRAEAFRLLSGPRKIARVPPLWDGHASERIVKSICEWFDGRTRSPQAEVKSAA